MSFKDLKGQVRPITLLKYILNTKRLPSAFLFLGEEGIGKLSTAKIFAKALNCQKLKDDSCDECVSCRKIDNNNHPDVHLILYDAANEAIKIEEIRQLQRQTNLKAFEGKKKVCIIDEAHNLTPEASNAFLKILEEPPPDTVFILVSSKPALIFSTITSRCQRVRFTAMKKEALREILKRDYGLDENLSHFLSYFSEGRLGCALRFKDIDILRQKNEFIDSFLNEAAYFKDLEGEKRLNEAIKFILAYLRDIYLLKAGIGHSELINLDRRQDLLKIMTKFTFYDLDISINYLSDVAMYLGQNINPKLILANLRMRLWRRLHR